jgi:hypothetical protein
MNNAALALSIIALSSAPAMACHRFHVWNYPGPQRCAVTDHADASIRRSRLARLDAGRPAVRGDVVGNEEHPLNDDSWYVEIVRSPDDIVRERGLDMLRMLLETK